MTFESEEFHPQAAKRLENKKEAKAAEQWLLSEEFDNFAELLSWNAEGFHQQPAVA